MVRIVKIVEIGGRGFEYKKILESLYLSFCGCCHTLFYITAAPLHLDLEKANYFFNPFADIHP